MLLFCFFVTELEAFSDHLLQYLHPQLLNTSKQINERFRQKIFKEKIATHPSLTRRSKVLSTKMIPMIQM